MTAYLGRQGVQVNVKRVRRLMRKMGLERLPQAEAQLGAPGASGVSISVARSSDCQAESGVVYGHYAHSTRGRVCLSYGDYGLV